MKQAHPLYDFYRNLYFHEVEAREHLNARLQMPVVLMISLTGAVAFMLQNFKGDFCDNIGFVFIAFMLLSFVSIAVSLYYFFKASVGAVYSFLPSALDTEKYRQELDETYKGYKDGDNLSNGYLKQYLNDYFIKCSSNNTKCNDERSLHLHKCHTWLMITAVLAFISFVLFFAGNFSKARNPEPQKIIIVGGNNTLGATP